MHEATFEETDLNLGEWTLCVQTQRLVRGEERHILDPKEHAVLIQLVRAAPAVVSTAELLSRAWPGVVVGDNAVQQVVTRLRRVLSDDARNPRYIETLPKRGYRLLVPVTSAEASLTPRGEQMANSLAIRRSVLVALFVLLTLSVGMAAWFQAREQLPPGGMVKKIAVVPFRDLTPTGDLGWLAYGLVFEMSHQLGELPGYVVVPASSIDNGKRVSLPADVDLVLEGYVQETRKGIVVAVQALDRKTGEQHWAEPFLGIREDPYDL